MKSLLIAALLCALPWIGDYKNVLRKGWDEESNTVEMQNPVYVDEKGWYKEFRTAEVQDSVFMDELCNYLDLSFRDSLRGQPMRIIFSTIEDEFVSTGFDRERMVWTGYNPVDKSNGLYLYIKKNTTWKYGYMAKYRDYVFFFLNENYMNLIVPTGRTEIFFEEEKEIAYRPYNQFLLRYENGEFRAVDNKRIMINITQ